MPESFNNKNFLSFIIPVLSISGLLYLIAFSATFLQLSIRTSYFSAEQIPFIVELSDSISESDIFRIEQQISKSNYCVPSSARFISKADAINKLISEDIKKEELEIFDEELLPNIIEFRIKSSFAHKENEIIENLKKETLIVEVIKNQEIAGDLHNNLYRIRMIASLLLIFFIFVAAFIVYLINRINFSKIGDKNNKDYLNELYKWNIKSGVISGLLASMSFIFTFFISGNLSDEKVFLIDLISLSIIVFTIFIFGVILFWGSFRLVTNKKFISN